MTLYVFTVKTVLLAKQIGRVKSQSYSNVPLRNAWSSDSGHSSNKNHNGERKGTILDMVIMCLFSCDFSVGKQNRVD